MTVQSHLGFKPEAPKTHLEGCSFSRNGAKTATMTGAKNVNTVASLSGSRDTAQNINVTDPNPANPRTDSSQRLRSVKKVAGNLVSCKLLEQIRRNS